VFEFTAASFTTAMVLEALVRHELAHCGRAGPVRGLRNGPAAAGAQKFHLPSLFRLQWSANTRDSN